MSFLKIIGLNKKHFFLFFILIIAGIVSAFAVNKLTVKKNEVEDLIGKEFEQNNKLLDISYLDYKTKQQYTNNLKQGKVLLTYLITGCLGCKKEIEVLSSVDLAQYGVSVFGIADEDTTALSNFSIANNLSFPIIFDEGSKFRKTLDIKYFPANFVIENGVITKSWFGNPKDKEDLLQKLELVK